MGTSALRKVEEFVDLHETGKFLLCRDQVLKERSSSSMGDHGKMKPLERIDNLK
jgi:hypothetical protein